jgi:arginine N-succinyltransferase
MTSLNIDKPQLADRIERSHFAFRRTMEKPEGAPYVFVMQDTETKSLIGTSCIFSKTGGFEPFYAYRVVNEVSHSELLQQSYDTRSLQLVKIHNGPTEIGSLFLLPEYRGKGCGKLLSMSRFAYMAQKPKRFSSSTIAEMRGYLNEQNESPFWDAIGAHFFKMDFPRADSLSMIDKQFIEDLMPKHPIYLDLLPEPAKQALGRVHNQTKAALAMLETQGFRRNSMVDIFDGGPIVECPTAEIMAIKNSRLLPLAVNNAAPDPSKGNMIRGAVVTANRSPFVAIQCDVHVIGDQAWIDEECRSVLGIRPGDSIRI